MRFPRNTIITYLPTFSSGRRQSLIWNSAIIIVADGQFYDNDGPVFTLLESHFDWKLDELAKNWKWSMIQDKSISRLHPPWAKLTLMMRGYQFSHEPIFHNRPLLAIDLSSSRKEMKLWTSFPLLLSFIQGGILFWLPESFIISTDSLWVPSGLILSYLSFSVNGSLLTRCTRTTLD